MKTVKTILSIGALLTLILLVAPKFGGSTPTVTELVNRFEEKQQSWAYFEADIALDFFLAEGRRSNCAGKLFFQRLSEKFLLTCHDQNEELFFALRAEDMNFWLHLPTDQALITGNIFDLEFSEEFDSFIKPLAIYRALKPSIPSSREAKVGAREELRSELIQEKLYRGKPYTARKIILTDSGDIPEEIFLLPSGEIMTLIHRKDFQPLPWKKPSSIATSILIRSPKDETGLALTITEIQSTELPEDDVFILEIPRETEIIKIQSLEEEPRHPGWSRRL